ncbi:MAG: Crp/Fnr family transcriptional regulator [Bacteroidia bacterium]
MNLSTNQQKFKDFLLQHSTLTEEQQNELITNFEELHLAKVECFAEQDRLCNRIGFLVSGLLCATSCDANDKKYTYCFYEPNMLAMSYKSFTKQTLSSHSIKALADSTLLVVDRETLKNILPSDYEKELLHLFLQKAYLLMDEHAQYLSVKTAEDAYYKFIKEHPAVKQHATKDIIASYLGVRREILSFTPKKKAA